MRNPAIFSLLIIISLAAGLTSTAQASATPDEILYSQDFNSGSAEEWQLSSGWSIVPSEGGFALQGVGHTWAELTSGPWEDHYLQFRIDLDAGAGLHANIRKSGASRYMIGLGREQSYISRQDDKNTFHNQLAIGTGIAAGWHTIRVSARAGTIEVQCDGKQLISYTDPSPLAKGGVAIENLGEAAIRVDDVIIGVSGSETLGADAVAATAAAHSQAGPLPTNPAPSTDIGLTWVYTGGPLGGLGYDVRMSPDNPDIMFVTDAKAGVFKSTDGGKNWQPSNDGITSRIGATGELIPVFSLTISPTDPNLIWAGTTEVQGAFKSTNGGQSWQKMVTGMTGENLTLRGFAFDPKNNDVVYSTGEVPSWDWNGSEIPGRLFDKVKGVVFKSTNGGQSWKEIWKGNNLARYVLIDPRDSNVLYLSTGIFDREAADSDWQTKKPGGEGILKSTDGGQTWHNINKGLNNLYIGSLFMHPTNPDILLAGAGNTTYPEGSGVYITKDRGETWKQTLDNTMITSVEISTANSNIAYAGQYQKFFRSEDGGLTWNEIINPGGGWGPPGVLGGHPIDFQVDPRNADRLFSNSYGGGNFLTEDGGVTWMDTSRGYTGAMMRDIAVDPTSPGHVFAVGGSGFFESRNGGSTWTSPNRSFRPGISNTVTINPSNPAHLLFEMDSDSGLFISLDGGRSFSLTNAVPQLYGGAALAFAPSDPLVVYYGDQSRGPEGFKSIGILRSNDGGSTWKSANDANSAGAVVNQIAVDPRDPMTAYAATMNKGVIKTTDGGANWTSIGSSTFATSDTPSPEFTGNIAVEIATWDRNIIFIGVNRGGLWASKDGGVTWQRSSDGLNPEATVKDMLCDSTQPGVMYLADLFSGVYRSQDSGKTWQAINNGLLNRAVNKLAISADGLHLYAGTEGMGVFRLDLNSQPPASIPEREDVPMQPIKTSDQPNNPGQPGTDIEKQTAEAASTPIEIPTAQPAAENPSSGETSKTGNPLFPRCSALPVGMVISFSLWNTYHKRRKNDQSHL